MSKAEFKDFTFKARHIGPSKDDEVFMLQHLGYENLEEFISSVIPNEIFDSEDTDFSMPDGCNQNEALKKIKIISKKNLEYRSLIGLGYHSTVIPPVVQRNVLENPNWYTAYTPYQAEISQGRLEALFNFQTLISELTGLPARYKSPIESNILCLTNSSLNLKPSLFKIFFSPTTTALSKEPPSANPLACK